MITIAIANQKGGVGKTTTAIELAAAMKELGKNVLVIDLDQQCNLSKYAGADMSIPSIYECLKAECPVNDTIQQLPEFDLIRASESLSRADREFPEADDVFLLLDLLDCIREQYDYVFLDNSPSRNVLLTMAYVGADSVIIPTECDDGSLDGIIAISKDVKKLRESRGNFSHAVVDGIILNKFEKTLMHASSFEAVEEIAKEIGSNPFVMTVRKGIAASESKKVKKSLQMYNKYSNTATDYRQIAREIEKRTGGN